MSNEVFIYTDGSYQSSKKGVNYQIGGYGVVIVEEDNADIIELFGSKHMPLKESQACAMEIIAVIKALEFFKESRIVTVYCDNVNVVEAINTRLILWKQAEWVKEEIVQVRRHPSKRRLKNIELYKQLYDLIMFHDIIAVWVKAHKDNVWNCRADSLAKYAVKTHKQRGAI